MIRKCNTSHSKPQETPYNAIKVREFIDNEEEEQAYQSCQGSEYANDQLNLNIMKIKECKKQTQQFISEMNRRLIMQNQSIVKLDEAFRQERERCRMYRLKYNEAMLGLRRKEEENERLERNLADIKEKYQFFVNSADQNLSDWIMRQQRYKETISSLQHIAYHPQETITVTYTGEDRFMTRSCNERSFAHSKQQESTFI